MPHSGCLDAGSARRQDTAAEQGAHGLPAPSPAVLTWLSPRSEPVIENKHVISDGAWPLLTSHPPGAAPSATQRTTTAPRPRTHHGCSRSLADPSGGTRKRRTVTPEAELRLSALHGGKGLCSAPRSRARAHPARRPAPSAPHRLTAHARPRKEKRAEPAAAPRAPRHLPQIEDVSVHPTRPTTSNGSAHTKAPTARCTSSKHQHSHC